MAALAAVLLPAVHAAHPAYCDVRSTTPFTRGRELQGEPTSTLGLQKLLFLRVRFPDDTADPVSTEEAQSTLAALNEVFQRISYGAYGLTSTVSAVVHLATPRDTYSGVGGFDQFLDDARKAGIDAGFDYRDYDLEVVRHSGVPGFAGGNARLGTRGAQVQMGGHWILVHELGHNLGLSHANFWDTSGPGIALGSPPLPSNYETLPDPRSIAIHPESTIGHETVTGPGSAIEYGDPWDVMGTGDSDFSATYKRYLGWLTEASFAVAPPGRSLHRIVGLESQNSNAGLALGVRISSPGIGSGSGDEIEVGLPVVWNGIPPRPGVVIRWVDPSDGHRSSLVLDGTPISPAVNADAILPEGRTFVDRAAGVWVTPVAHGLDGSRRWADVVVVRGLAPSNATPSIQLSWSSSTVATGESVVLTAAASDTDGDDLAWYWDFGDAGSTTNNPLVTKAWSEPGDYVVHVEVSDMRGGVARGQIAIHVGDPRTRRVSGRVLDTGGKPVAGVWVHHGIGGGERPVGPRIQSRTDDSGTFTLTGLKPGRYPISAFHPDYILQRRPEVEIGDSDIDGHDFVATPLPQVSVSGPAEVHESAGFIDLFTFTRSGPLEGPLTVLFRLGGSASGGSDYVPPLLDRVVIPNGSASVTLGMPIIDDSQGEATKSLQVTVTHPVRFTRTDSGGNRFDVYFPGWEITDFQGAAAWTRTRPEYVPGAGAVAEVVLIDDDEFRPQTVSLIASDIIALERPLVESSFTLTRSGDTADPLSVDLATGGTALPSVDYEAIPLRVDFEPGETSRVLGLRPIADDLDEPPEEAVLQILPGADYAVGLGSATLIIRDNLTFPQTLAISSRPDAQIQVVMKGAPGSRLVLEGSSNLLDWVALRTNQLFNTDSASVLLTPAGASRFFRTSRMNQTPE